MSRTRAELDRKIGALEERAHELTPRALARRYLPENAVDYALGSVLTLVGARMAWRQYRASHHRREQLQTLILQCGGW